MSLTGRGRAVVWVAWLVVGLLLLDVVELTVYGVVVPVSALALASVPGTVSAGRGRVDARDLRVVGLFYVVVVALLYAGRPRTPSQPGTGAPPEGAPARSRETRTSRIGYLTGAALETDEPELEAQVVGDVPGF